MENVLIDIRYIKFLKKIYNHDTISVEKLIDLLEDTIDEKERIEEELEDLKQEMKDNYRPITNKEMYDI